MWTDFRFSPNNLSHEKHRKKGLSENGRRGGDKLRAAGVNLHSLAIIESAEPGHIVFREEA